MNYNHFKKYLERELIEYQQGELAITEQFFITFSEYSNYQEEPAREELAKTLSNFVDSLVASYTEKDDYHQLPAQIFTAKNYFASNKPSLGKRTSNVAIISEEHYQVLDAITDYFLANWAVNSELVTDFQAKAKLYQELLADPANPNPAFTISQIEQWISDYGALTYFTKKELAADLKACQQMLANYTGQDNTSSQSLETKFLIITEQVKTLLDSKLTADAQLLGETIKVFGQEVLARSEGAEFDLLQSLPTKGQAELEPIFKILLSYPESKPIIAEIKQWLIDYKKLTTPEQEIIADEYQSINLVDQIIISCQKKKKQAEEDNDQTTEKPTKDDKYNIKDKDGLIYLFGAIALVGILTLLFSNNKRN